MKNLMQKNRILENCPACEGTKKVKNVKTIIQIGKFYLGKEVFEECKLCPELLRQRLNEICEDTIH